MENIYSTGMNILYKDIFGGYKSYDPTCTAGLSKFRPLQNYVCGIIELEKKEMKLLATIRLRQTAYDTADSMNNWSLSQESLQLLIVYL